MPLSRPPERHLRKRVRAERPRHVAVLVDLQGPRIRGGDVPQGRVPLWYLTAVVHLPEPRLALVAAVLFLGHLYPVYLGFKGGKGVATALGVLLVLSPLATVPACLIFAAVLWRWRYVSAASISAAASIPFLVWLFERSLPSTAAALFIAAMVIIRHRANIGRLLAGTENRFKA